MESTKVVVNDLMQRIYTYLLTEPEGEHFDPDFRPELTPAQLLAMGVFGGRYMTDCRQEFPTSWFDAARLPPIHSAYSIGMRILLANAC